MTDDLRDLLARAGRDEASATRREDFHGAFGDAVRGRVKRRRAVRAAGVGSVAAVSVGAIAFGAVRLPGMPDAGPLGAADCPPGTVASVVGVGGGAAPSEPGVEPTAHAIDVTSERDLETWLLYDDVAQEVVLEVAVVRGGVIEVTEPGGEPYRVPPNDELGNFVFEAPSGGWVTFSPGDMPALDWSLDAPVEVMFDGSTYTVSSASGASAELFVEDGELRVREPGGYSGLRAQDGVYTIELSDGVVVNAELDRDSGGLIAWTDEDSAESGVVVVTDAEPGLVCVTPEPSPTPSTAVDACVDGSWRIDAEVLRPDLVYGVTNTEDPDSQESSVPGVAIQPMLLGPRVITVALDAGTGEPLAMLEVAEPEQELLVRLSEDDGLRVAKDDDGTFTFQLLDGRWMTVADDDGPWNGQDIAGLSGEMPGAVSASAAPDDGVSWTDFSRELAEDFDLEWPAAPWVCNATRTGNVDGNDGAITSPSPAPSPGVSADPAAASSPYQCGFEFPEESRLTEEWAIEDTAWLSPSDAWERIEQQFADPIDGVFVEPTEPVLTVWADGSLTGSGTAESLGAQLGTADPRDANGNWIVPETQPEASSYAHLSIGAVMVSDGVVVAMLDEAARKTEPRSVHIEPGRDNDGFMRMYVLDTQAFVPCDGADTAGDQIYAVSGGATLMPDGTVTDPIYGWQEIENP